MIGLFNHRNFPNFGIQVPHYVSANVPSKIPALTQMLAREKSAKHETNKIFPCAPKSLRTAALQPTCRTHSVDAAYEDPGETAIILAVPAPISWRDDIVKTPSP